MQFHIFQTWKSRDPDTFPPVYKKCQESWNRLHPRIRYNLYDDIDNKNIISINFPGVLEDAFNLAVNPVEKADIIRYVISFLDGGLYVDMDFIALKDHEPLYNSFLNSQDGIVFGLMEVEDTSNSWYFNNNIPNAWSMTMNSKEVFWLLLLDEICHRMPQKDLRPEIKTGPVVLKECIEKYKNMPDLDSVVSSFRYMNCYLKESLILRQGKIRILEPVSVYPYSWTDRSELSENQKFFLENDWDAICSKFPDSIAFTYWLRNWEL